METDDGRHGLLLGVGDVGSVGVVQRRHDGGLGKNSHGGDGDKRVLAALALELRVTGTAGSDGEFILLFFGEEKVIEIDGHLADVVVPAIIEHDGHLVILGEGGNRDQRTNI